MTRQPIGFTKMHGLGNDFVIINANDHLVDVKSLAISQLADRHVGIGFDQLLIIEPSNNADFFCRIYNADGSEAEQCGNGLRCIARFIHEEGLLAKSALRIETKAGIFPVSIEDYNRICVTIGAPSVEEKLVEFPAKADSDNLSISILSLGNPHAIVKVESIEAVQTNVLGPKIATHSRFPEGANVGFMQVINHHHIRLRTFERGVGETFACGSNACAAVVAGRINGWLKNSVDVEFRYGSLSIEWEGGDKPILMTGPAARVFSGEIVR